MRKVANVVKFLALVVALMPVAAFAQDAHGASAASAMLPIGAGIAIGLAAIGGTLGQGKTMSATLESIGRNPSASGALFLPMILGMALIESLVIIAFVIANGLTSKI